MKRNAVVFGAILASLLTACVDVSIPKNDLLMSSYEVSGMQGSAQSETMTSENAVDAMMAGSEWKAPPSATGEDYYRSLTTYWQELARCLEERGWADQGVEDPNTPFVTINIAGFDGQEARYISDLRECRNEIGPEPTGPPVNRDTARDHYRVQTKFSECAQQQGYTISSPPSEQQFVDDFVQEKQGWNPQRELIDSGQMLPHELSDFHAVCPYW